MDDLVQRLQIALAGRYEIQREIGAGATAIVYSARDMRHQRPVAIKVLRPELAEALGPERFLREIEIAAGLDHPHIVPLFDSGAADGLLFHVMPLAEGESLRDRLAREKQLPVGEALQIARAVADALAYAHERGVVHRDIKPENILLSGGHARVADFGIARAITAAGADRLTRTGLALGTPAYMSPEQAAGDDGVDARSDVYSLGCVLFEMLAGMPPFPGATLERVLHQHLVAEPPALTVLRPTVGPELDAMVRRMLAKVPADRFSPTAALAAALERAQHAAARHTPRRSRGAVPIGIAAATLLIAVTGYVAVRAGASKADSLIATGALAERQRALLADFDNHSPDPTHGPAVTELLRVALSQMAVVNVLDPVQVGPILELMRRDASAGLPRDVAFEAAQREGIGAVVHGEVRTVGRSIVITARISAADGAQLATLRETAAGPDDLVGAVDRLGAQLRRRVGDSLRRIRRSPPLERVTTASMPALRLYVQSLGAWNRGDQDQAIRLIEDAIRTDSTFAMAHRRLAILLNNYAARRADAVRAATLAYQYRDRLTEREAGIVTGSYHTVVTGNVDRAISAYRSLLEAYPQDHYGLNNLAVAYGRLREFQRAGDLMDAALRADSTVRIHYSNLASNLARRGMFDSASVILDRFGRRYPRNPEVTVARVVNAAMRKDYARAGVLGDSLIREQRGTVYWEATAYEWLGSLAALRGELRLAREQWRRAFELTAQREIPDQYLDRAARTAVVEALIGGNPAAGQRRLDDALERYALDSLAPLDRRYPQLALAYAALGRTDRARELLAEWRGTPDADHAHDARGWAAGASGVIALAERNYAEALTHLRAFDEANPCETCAYAWLARAFDESAQSDSAVAYYTRLVETPSAGIWYDAPHLIHAYRRLGELHEARADTDAAIDHYNRLLALWQNADPELQPILVQVRQRLRVLAGEPHSPG